MTHVQRDLGIPRGQQLEWPVGPLMEAAVDIVDGGIIGGGPVGLALAPWPPDLPTQT
jgi:hypothetical protein